MRKVIVDISHLIAEDVRVILDLPPNGEFPPLPGKVYAYAECHLKLYGDWLPNSFETKEGETIQSVSIEQMQKLIGGVK